MQIELIYFAGCPHVGTARANLRAALTRTGRGAEWTEWDTGASTTPEAYRRLASPTVLVSGVDLEAKPMGSGGGCTVGGGPSVEQLMTALRLAAR